MWNDLVEKFLEKYFPLTTNSRLILDIMQFAQLEDKALSDTWERFKRLLQRCLHHSLPHCVQLETFYSGLDRHTQVLADTSAGGALLRKTYNEAYDLLDRMSKNNSEWGSAADKRKAKTKKKI